jgi:hypothetical protein
VSAVDNARLAIYRMVWYLPERDVLLVAALVRRLPYATLLERQQARVLALWEARGTTLQIAGETVTQHADTELLAALRAVARAEGIHVPPPGKAP